jgi:hypothetical protein
MRRVTAGLISVGSHNQAQVREPSDQDSLRGFHHRCCERRDQRLNAISWSLTVPYAAPAPSHHPHEASGTLERRVV